MTFHFVNLWFDESYALTATHREEKDSNHRERPISAELFVH